MPLEARSSKGVHDGAQGTAMKSKGLEMRCRQLLCDQGGVQWGMLDRCAGEADAMYGVINNIIEAYE
jgi:hypothetical protein